MMKNRKKIIILGVVGIIFGCFFLLQTNDKVQAVGGEGGIGQMQGNPGYDTTSGTMKTAEEKTKELQQMYPSATTATPTSGAAYRNQEKIPGFGQTSNFPDYLKQIVNFGFAAIGIMAMFMLMIGAYQYLMAAGNIAKEDSAKTTISSAFSGLVLGLVAFLLLRTINPDLVSFNLAVLQGGLTGTSRSLPGTITSSQFGTVPLSASTKNRIAAYNPYIQAAHAKYPDVSVALIKAVIDSESQGNQNAVSPKGALGLMQLMPGTAATLGVDPRDPAQNIMGGTAYLNDMLKQFNGNTELAVAAYNMGPNALIKRGNNYQGYGETPAFVNKVMGKMNGYGVSAM